MSIIDEYFRHLDASRRARSISENSSYSRIQTGVIVAYEIVLMSFPQLVIAILLTKPALYILKISGLPNFDWLWDAVFSSLFFCSSFIIIVMYIQWKFKQE